jgi:tetratricopeptide (TPR) repeat protein
MGLARSPSDLGLVSQALASEEAIAEMLAHQGNHPEALEMARKAIARAEQLSVPDSERFRVTRAVAIAYQNLATVEVIFGNWSEARVAAQHAVDGWRQAMAAGSGLADPAKVARAEALLKDCNAHLH